jgi:glycosyltransferase involved in cell wall biosynthesis
MKVLMISGDARMFEPGTEANKRYILQKSQVEELKAVVWSPRRPLAFFAVLAQALTRRFDVVTAQDPLWRGMLGWIAARIGGAKFQAQVHGDLSVLNSFNHALAQIVLWHADLVRVVSERIKVQAEAIGTRTFVDVLPVFVDLDAVRATPAADLKKEFPQFGKFVLFVGRLEAEKNCAGAIEAFAEVSKEFPGAGLLVAGTGSQLRELQALARNLGLAQRVVFLGYRADVLSLYKAADAMLVTSLHESFGAAMLEALCAGCPVVAPDVGVMREAGATVVERPYLAQAVISALKSGGRGILRVQVLGKDEWAARWRETLQ